MQPAQRFESSPAEAVDPGISRPAAADDELALSSLPWPPTLDELDTIAVVLLSADGVLEPADLRRDLSRVPAQPIAAAPGPLPAGIEPLDVVTALDGVWPEPETGGGDPRAAAADLDRQVRELLALETRPEPQRLSSAPLAPVATPADDVAATAERPSVDVAGVDVALLHEVPFDSTVLQPEGRSSPSKRAPAAAVAPARFQSRNRRSAYLSAAAAVAVLTAAGAYWLIGDRTASSSRESRSIASPVPAPAVQLQPTPPPAVTALRTTDSETPAPALEPASTTPIADVVEQAPRVTATADPPAVPREPAVKAPIVQPPAVTTDRRPVVTEVASAPELPGSSAAENSLAVPPPPAPPASSMSTPATGNEALARSGPPPSPTAIEASAAGGRNTRDIEVEVRNALASYRDAYAKLDAAAARDIWPGVDERALARAFSGLRSQQLEFDRCDISVQVPTATATCIGRAVYVQMVGRQEPRVESRRWVFTLRQDSGAWRIDRTEIRK